MKDPKLAKLLSEIFLDISKAYFIAVLVTPSFSQGVGLFDIWFKLTFSFFNGILFLMISRVLLEFTDR